MRCVHGSRSSPICVLGVDGPSSHAGPAGADGSMCRASSMAPGGVERAGPLRQRVGAVHVERRELEQRLHGVGREPAHGRRARARWRRAPAPTAPLVTAVAMLVPLSRA